MFAALNTSVMEKITPKPEVGTTTLGEDQQFVGTTSRSVKTFTSFNAGNRTLSLVMSLYDLQRYTAIANDRSKPEERAQRPLDVNHARKIGKYILKGLLIAAKRKRLNHHKEVSQAMSDILREFGHESYVSIAPIVASYRDCAPGGTDINVQRLEVVNELASYKVFLHDRDTFWIVDGQHRRAGLKMVADFLEQVLNFRKYPTQIPLYRKKGTKEVSAEEMEVWQEAFEQMRECHVTVEVHLGLSIEDERQLFHDLNNLGKAVEKGLSFQFDDTDPVNLYIRDHLEEGILEGLVVMKDKVNWDEREFGYKDLTAVNAVLFMNKTTTKGASAIDVEEKTAGANTFWQLVTDKAGWTAHGAENMKKATVLGQPVVLKALAKLWYDYNWGRNTELNTPENRQRFVEGLSTNPDLNFSHDNPMWRYYELPQREREDYGIAKLAEYLPIEAEGNRDIGKWDPHGKVFRFGAKHNDIFPIIGDMIRWKLGLPKRHKSEQLELQEG